MVTIRKIKVKRRAYVRRDGVKVKGTTYLAKDRGKKGLTPRQHRWFHPKTRTGWKKDMPVGKRRREVLSAHGGDSLAAARGLQQLANVTVDRDTKVEARKDALYFFKEYGQGR